jgi:hypothetical protein
MPARQGKRFARPIPGLKESQDDGLGRGWAHPQTDTKTDRMAP